MSSTDTPSSLSTEQRQTLLQVARRSIEQGLSEGRPLTVDPGTFEAELQAVRATFVTLERQGELRGCIGHLEAVQPLVSDVAENAFSAAFRDPRFPPMDAAEWPGVSVHISILTPAEPLRFEDEPDLLSQLRPGVDGLILSDGPNRGTFLPAVWESLPDPEDFFRQLKRKAGLPPDHWSSHLQVARYRTESFGDGEDDAQG